MGFIVGHESYALCDICHNEGPKHFNQTKAMQLALDKWWYHSNITGRMQCPDCRKKFIDKMNKLLGL